jgi:hypothetical protein
MTALIITRNSDNVLNKRDGVFDAVFSRSLEEQLNTIVDNFTSVSSRVEALVSGELQKHRTKLLKKDSSVLKDIQLNFVPLISKSLDVLWNSGYSSGSIHARKETNKLRQGTAKFSSAEFASSEDKKSVQAINKLNKLQQDDIRLQNRLFDIDRKIEVVNKNRNLTAAQKENGVKLLQNEAAKINRQRQKLEQDGISIRQSLVSPAIKTSPPAPILSNETKPESPADINRGRISSENARIKKQADDKTKRQENLLEDIPETSRSRNETVNTIASNIRGRRRVESSRTREIDRELQASGKSGIPIIQETEFGKAYLQYRNTELAKQYNDSEVQRIRSAVSTYLSSSSQVREYDLIRAISKDPSATTAKSVLADTGRVGSKSRKKLISEEEINSYENELNSKQQELKDIQNRIAAGRVPISVRNRAGDLADEINELQQTIGESKAALKNQANQYSPGKVVKLSLDEQKALGTTRKEITVGELEQISQKGIPRTNRLKRIAVTELSAAYNLGRIADMQKQGVRRVIWNRSIERYPCVVCETRANNSPYLIEELLTRKDLVIPAHPSCRCYVSLDPGDRDIEPPPVAPNKFNDNVEKWAVGAGVAILSSALMYQMFRKYSPRIRPPSIAEQIRNIRLPQLDSLITETPVGAVLRRKIANIPLNIQTPETVPAIITQDPDGVQSVQSTLNTAVDTEQSILDVSRTVGSRNTLAVRYATEGVRLTDNTLTGVQRILEEAPNKIQYYENQLATVRNSRERDLLSSDYAAYISTINKYLDDLELAELSLAKDNNALSASIDDTREAMKRQYAIQQLSLPDDVGLNDVVNNTQKVQDLLDQQNIVYSTYQNLSTVKDEYTNQLSTLKQQLASNPDLISTYSTANNNKVGDLAVYMTGIEDTLKDTALSVEFLEDYLRGATSNNNITYQDYQYILKEITALTGDKNTAGSLVNIQKNINRVNLDFDLLESTPANTQIKSQVDLSKELSARLVALQDEADYYKNSTPSYLDKTGTSKWTRIRQLSDQQTRLTNTIANTTDAATKRILQQQLQQLNSEIDNLGTIEFKRPTVIGLGVHAIKRF